MIQTLRELAAKYRPLATSKMDSRLKSLDEMADYYANKAKQSPTQKAVKMRQLANSIQYAITVIKMHRNLTIKVEELAGEAKADEARTNSKG